MSAEQTPEAPKYTPSQIKAATTREAVLKTLLDQVKEAYETARTDVQSMLDEQQKTTGGTKFEATLPDGTKVADIGLTGGEPAAQLVDEQLFVAWARERYPEHSVTKLVKSVRPAFVELLLGQMTAAGVAQVLDEDTGELLDVPGVAIKATRKRSHSVRFARRSKARADGRELIAAAWRAGALAEHVLPALAPAQPAGHDEGGAA
ncbi:MULTISPECIES: hypothetical protein [unclassified Streptomyces]|uniref:hypothetical protein n=1 Tax=unclassified Streptomyces TaxID=2593676 RepID=UPI003808F1BD